MGSNSFASQSSNDRLQQALRLLSNRVSILETNSSQSTPIATTYNEWIGLIQSNSLTPGAWYVFNDLLSSAEYFYFYAIDTQRINPEGIYYPIGINGQTEVPAIQVVLQIDQNGTVAGSTFDYFYEPIYNNKWYGWPGGNMGDTSGTRQFFDKLMGLDGNYADNIIEAGCTFNGIPVQSYRSMYQYLDGGYTFTGNANVRDSKICYSNNYGFSSGDGVGITGCIFGDAQHNIGDSASLSNIQTIAKDGTHYIPANCTVSNGVVGSLKPSASNLSPIDLGGSSTAPDLDFMPFLGHYLFDNAAIDPITSKPYIDGINITGDLAGGIYAVSFNGGSFVVKNTSSIKTASGLDVLINNSGIALFLVNADSTVSLIYPIT